MPRKKSIPTSFVIKRSEWLNYKTIDDEEAQDLRGSSMLYRPTDGKFCCLGQIAKQCGVPLKAMTGVLLPGNISERYKSLLPVSLRNIRGMCDITTLNDGYSYEKVYPSDKMLKGKKLEAKLTSVFKTVYALDIAIED